MRMPQKFLVSLAAGLLCLTAPGATTAQGLGQTPESGGARYPFVPHLETNQQPAICGPVLAELTRRFTVPGETLDLLSSPPANAWPWPSWLGLAAPALRHVTVRVSDRQQDLTVFDADLTGDGEPELLAAFSRTLSGIYRYEVHAIPRALVVGPAEAPATTYIADGNFVNQLSSASTEVLAAFVPMALFVYRDSLYVHSRHFEFSPFEPIDIQRPAIDPDSKRTTPQLLCRIRLAPENDPSKMLGIAALGDLPHLANFLSQASIAGSLGQGCSARATLQHATRFKRRLWEVLYTPTFVQGAADQTEAGDLTAADEVLVYWSHSGLWEYREYARIAAVRHQALPELARWYRDGFGVSSEDANATARRALVALTKSLTAGAYLPGAYLETTSEIPALDAALRVRLLEGVGTTAIRELLEKGANPESPEQAFFFNSEPALFYALEHPRLVRLLLEHGVDVNAVNHFGKTALMYAAQFNLPETARVLLQAGADPNRRTGQKQPHSCSPFKRIGRTALMYAAENAGEELMALLIDAGADTAVQDTLIEPSGRAGPPGDGILDYLARNEGLSKSEQDSIISRWQLK